MNREQVRHGAALVAAKLLGLVVVPAARARALRWLGASVGSNVRIHDVRFMNLDRGFSGLSIEDNVYVGPGCLFDLKDDIVIRRGAVLSPDVLLLTHLDVGEHHGSPTVRHFPSTSGPVVIGEHCYVGACTVIVNDVSIGDGAVVGACSLVLSDIEPGVLVAGIPARVLRRLDD